MAAAAATSNSALRQSLTAPPSTPSLTAISALIHRVQQRTSPLELVHTPHARWPLRPPPASPSRPPSPAPPSVSALLSERLRIAVLDSSFNPPTLAHLALASAPTPTANGSTHGAQEDYDARLLLLSVRNADKTPASGDATHAQRVAMMLLLAHTLEDTPGRSSAAHGNVAVAIIDEPTFVGKSAILRGALRARLSSLFKTDLDTAPPASDSHAHPGLEVELTFLLGLDTLERLAAPRYYASPSAMHAALAAFFSPPPAGDGSRVVCAHRVDLSPNAPAHPPSNPSDLTSETDAETARRADAALRAVGPAAAGRVAFIDLGAQARAISSSSVRTCVRAGLERWREMVPPRVAECIAQVGLYAPAPSTA